MLLNIFSSPFFQSSSHHYFICSKYPEFGSQSDLPGASCLLEFSAFSSNPNRDFWIFLPRLRLVVQRYPLKQVEFQIFQRVSYLKNFLPAFFWYIKTYHWLIFGKPRSTRSAFRYLGYWYFCKSSGFIWTSKQRHIASEFNQDLHRGSARKKVWATLQIHGKRRIVFCCLEDLHVSCRSETDSLLTSTILFTKR